ncbi:MAG: hypothetical protein A3G41_06225 [Elusimicrobia bacterium RIFCSPLOWO2_12_FULL_59_9]|nr:MAG: hypothetical protein A3G41_06225 [Elusimicrobia bacterium RIFCSPLOWO2_12_FULL_59_9]
MPTKDRPNLEDAGLNKSVSAVLAGGLILALFLMLLGTALAWKNSGGFSPRATPLAELAAALRRLEPTAVASLGIIVLLATPALRVAALLAGYARRRQWFFAAISASVLAVLALSLSLGR